MKTVTKKNTPAKTGKMENSEFHEFFVDELKDIYWAEKHLVKALPKMKKAATSAELAAELAAEGEEGGGVECEPASLPPICVMK